MIKVCIEVEAGPCEKHRYNEKTLEYNVLLTQFGHY